MAARSHAKVGSVADGYAGFATQPAGHPVDSLEFVQLNAASEVPDTAELAAENGNPVWCDTAKQSGAYPETSATAASCCCTSTCTAQWPGYDEEV